MWCKKLRGEESRDWLFFVLFLLCFVVECYYYFGMKQMTRCSRVETSRSAQRGTRGAKGSRCVAYICHAHYMNEERSREDWMDCVCWTE